MGGVAAVAGTAGWLAARLPWRAAPPPADPAIAALWAAVFDTPAGGSLAMAGFKGQPLLINFWATWCPPCVEEMPMLERFQQEQRAYGWQVVGLAIDQPTAVRAFLQRSPVGFPIGVAGFAGTDLSRSLGNSGNTMPFSVVTGRDARVAHRKIGQIQPADLRAWTHGG